MILLIDNYDSFVFNLARYFTELGQTVRVVRNDAISVTEVVQLKPAGCHCWLAQQCDAQAAQG